MRSYNTSNKMELDEILAVVIGVIAISLFLGAAYWFLFYWIPYNTVNGREALTMCVPKPTKWWLL